MGRGLRPPYREWIPVAPDAISCAERDLSLYLAKRLLGPVDGRALEEEMLRGAIDEGLVDESVLEELGYE